MEHRLQINDGAVAAAEFVELSEFNPLIEIEPLEGWSPGAGEGRKRELFNSYSFTSER